jgi:hypothetical protein
LKINEYGVDGFLGLLHCLLLMDDTVILATSRRAMVKKLKLLVESTKALKYTKVHPVKSKFFAINTNDKEPFVIEDIVISHTDLYVYLGTFMSDDTINQQVIQHIDKKQSHARKLYSFLSKNADAPFCVKRQVWDSALTFAILYSCESWWTRNLTCVQSTYLATAKALLGVRMQTPSDLVYIELDIPSVQCLVKKKQIDFLQKVKNSEFFEKCPLKVVLNMARDCKCPMGLYLSELESSHIDPVTQFKNSIREKVTSSQSSRCTAYKCINPTLSTHEMYSRQSHVFEQHRIATTRILVGSHLLKVETGRWSRIPRENRTCSCGNAVQTEDHVLINCPETDNLRQRFSQLPFTSTADLMGSPQISQLCKYCYEVLNLYA